MPERRAVYKGGNKRSQEEDGKQEENFVQSMNTKEAPRRK